MKNEIKTLGTYAQAIQEKIKKLDDGYIKNCLTNPKPQDIRDACVWRYKQINNNVDHEIVDAFFDFPVDELRKKKIIEWTHTSKFKRIVSFIEEESNTSKERLNIIAWLIDFKPRPYSNYINRGSENYTVVDEIYQNNLKDKNHSEQAENRKDDPLGSQISSTNKTYLYIGIPVLIILFLILNVVTGIGEDVNDIANKCLVWEENHYEIINCNETEEIVNKGSIIPFDQKLFEGFRKFSKLELDSISRYEKGGTKVWVGNNQNGGKDYFTASGNHPETGKPLIEEISEEKQTVDAVSNTEDFDSNRQNEMFEKPETIGKRIGVYIFNGAKIDPTASDYIENSFFANYKGTKNILTSSTLTNTNRDNLLRGNFNFLGSALKKETDFLCVGSITYRYEKSTLNNKMVTCFLNVAYNVYSSSGIKQKGVEPPNPVSGIGFTEGLARQNALSKLN